MPFPPLFKWRGHIKQAFLTLNISALSEVLFTHDVYGLNSPKALANLILALYRSTYTWRRFTACIISGLSALLFVSVTTEFICKLGRTMSSGICGQRRPRSRTFLKLLFACVEKKSHRSKRVFRTYVDIKAKPRLYRYIAESMDSVGYIKRSVKTTQLYWKI